MLARDGKPRRDDALRGRQCPLRRASGLPARDVAKQIADHALGAALERIALEIPDNAMQAVCEPAEHAAREIRAALQFLQDDRPAEALPRPQNLDHLLRPVARAEGELDLAVDHDVEARAGIALAKQDASGGHAHL